MVEKRITLISMYRALICGMHFCGSGLEFVTELRVQSNDLLGSMKGVQSLVQLTEQLY
jgi:hypothetical protein